MVENAVSEGRLVPLLDEHVRYEAGIFVVYPQSRYTSVNVRCFVDFLVAYNHPTATLME